MRNATRKPNAAKAPAAGEATAPSKATGHLEAMARAASLRAGVPGFAPGKAMQDWLGAASRIAANLSLA